MAKRKIDINLTVGDSVKVIKHEKHFLKYGEICQIVEFEGRGYYKQALLQSYDPSFGDGRWWVRIQQIEKVDISGKRALTVGRYVHHLGTRYFVVKIDESRYTLVCVKTGVARSLLPSLYLEDYFD